MKTITLLSILLVLLLLPQTKAEQKDPSQQPQLSKPVVFRLEGKATTTVKKTDTPMALKKGDALEIGSQVHTEINSRMVLAFGDGHHIRFDTRRGQTVRGADWPRRRTWRGCHYLCRAHSPLRSLCRRYR